jgi:hypothetical protein
MSQSSGYKPTLSLGNFHVPLQTAVRFQQVAGRIVCILYFLYPFLFTTCICSMLEIWPCHRRQKEPVSNKVDFFFSPPKGGSSYFVAALPFSRAAIFFKHNARSTMLVYTFAQTHSYECIQAHMGGASANLRRMLLLYGCKDLCYDGQVWWKSSFYYYFLFFRGCASTAVIYYIYICSYKHILPLWIYLRDLAGKSWDQWNCQAAFKQHMFRKWQFFSRTQINTIEDNFSNTTIFR